VIILLTRQLKGAKAPIIPFKNKNNNSSIVKSNEINSVTIFYISFSLSLSISLFLSLSLTGQEASIKRARTLVSQSA
jgi:hypothetical protein